jgi:hypothetical protein
MDDVFRAIGDPTRRLYRRLFKRDGQTLSALDAVCR